MQKICDDDTSNDNTTCTQDCAGVWGGDSWQSDCGCVEADNSGEYVILWGVCFNIETTTGLSLSSNQLTGEIPPEIGNLTNLTWLKLNDNQLTGEIPSEIGNLTNLTDLRLYNNQLTGEIPPEIGNLTNLTSLSLAYNQLSGEIPPEIGNLTNLTGLYLYDNQLTGEIPQEVCDLIENNDLSMFYILDGNNLINTCDDDTSNVQVLIQK